jgi:hypothetical protein
MSNSNELLNMFSGGSRRGASSSQILDMIHDYNSNMRRMIYLLETVETRVSANRNPLFTIDATSILTSLFDVSLGGLTNDQINAGVTQSLYASMCDASDNRITDTCPITMETLQSGDSVLRISRCGHLFKEGALRTWLERDGRCPVCRGTLQ